MGDNNREIRFNVSIDTTGIKEQVKNIKKDYKEIQKYFGENKAGAELTSQLASVSKAVANLHTQIDAKSSEAAFTEMTKQVAGVTEEVSKLQAKMRDFQGALTSVSKPLIDMGDLNHTMKLLENMITSAEKAKDVLGGALLRDVDGTMKPLDSATTKAMENLVKVEREAEKVNSISKSIEGGFFPDGKKMTTSAKKVQEILRDLHEQYQQLEEIQKKADNEKNTFGFVNTETLKEQYNLMQRYVEQFNLYSAIRKKYERKNENAEDKRDTGLYQWKTITKPYSSFINSSKDEIYSTAEKTYNDVKSLVDKKIVDLKDAEQEFRAQLNVVTTDLFKVNDGQVTIPVRLTSNEQLMKELTEAVTTVRNIASQIEPVSIPLTMGNFINNYPLDSVKLNTKDLANVPAIRKMQETINNVTDEAQREALNKQFSSELQTMLTSQIKYRMSLTVKSVTDEINKVRQKLKDAINGYTKDNGQQVEGFNQLMTIKPQIVMDEKSDEQIKAIKKSIQKVFGKHLLSDDIDKAISEISRAMDKVFDTKSFQSWQTGVADTCKIAVEELTKASNTLTTIFKSWETTSETTANNIKAAYESVNAIAKTNSSVKNSGAISTNTELSGILKSLENAMFTVNNATLNASQLIVNGIDLSKITANIANGKSNPQSPTATVTEATAAQIEADIKSLIADMSTLTTALNNASSEITGLATIMRQMPKNPVAAPKSGRNNNNNNNGNSGRSSSSKNDKLSDTDKRIFVQSAQTAISKLLSETNLRINSPYKTNEDITLQGKLNKAQGIMDGFETGRWNLTGRTKVSVENILKLLKVTNDSCANAYKQAESLSEQTKFNQKRTELLTKAQNNDGTIKTIQQLLSLNNGQLFSKEDTIALRNLTKDNSKINGDLNNAFFGNKKDNLSSYEKSLDGIDKELLKILEHGKEARNALNQFNAEQSKLSSDAVIARKNAEQKRNLIGQNSTYYSQADEEKAYDLYKEIDKIQTHINSLSYTNGNEKSLLGDLATDKKRLEEISVELDAILQRGTDTEARYKAVSEQLKNIQMYHNHLLNADGSEVGNNEKIVAAQNSVKDLEIEAKRMLDTIATVTQADVKKLTDAVEAVGGAVLKSEAGEKAYDIGAQAKQIAQFRQKIVSELYKAKNNSNVLGQAGFDNSGLKSNITDIIGLLQRLDSTATPEKLKESFTAINTKVKELQSSIKSIDGSGITAFQHQLKRLEKTWNDAKNNGQADIRLYSNNKLTGVLEGGTEEANRYRLKLDELNKELTEYQNQLYKATQNGGVWQDSERSAEGYRSKIAAIIKELESGALATTKFNSRGGKSTVIPSLRNNELSTTDSSKNVQLMQKYLLSLKGAQVETLKVDEMNNKATITIKRFGEAARTVGIEYDGMWREFNKSTSANVTLLARFNGLITHSIKFMAQYFSGYMLVMQAMSAIRNGISIVKDLDTAMVEVEKVSNETTQRYAEFRNEISQTAKEIAATNKELLSSSASWLRLGYSIDQAGQLAKSAQLFTNVGDGVDVDTATKNLITAMKAFPTQMQSASEQAMTIVDKYNEIGNTFAIDATGIGDIVERSASALATSGADLDDVIALGTAMNEIVQNSEQTGMALKTLSLRIRSAKADLENAGEDTEGMATSVSKLREQVKALSGVDIMLDANNYKPLVQIIKELGAVFPHLTDINKAALLEIIAGKNRANAMAALLKNYKQIDKIQEQLAKSEGSALRENQRIVDSIEGRMKTLSASGEEFWSKTINTDVIKEAVSGLTQLLNILTALVDKVGAVPLLAGGLSGLATVHQGGYFSSATNAVEQGELVDFVNQRNYKGLKRFAGNVGNYTQGWHKSIRDDFNMMSESGLGIVNYSTMANEFAKQKDVIAEASQELNNYSGNVAKTEASLGAFIQTQGSTNAALKRLVSLNPNITIKEAERGLEALGTTARQSSIGVNLLSGALNILQTVTVTLAITAVVTALYQLSIASKKVQSDAKDLGNTLTSITDNLDESKSKLEEYREVLNNAFSTSDEKNEARQGLVDLKDQMIDTYGYGRESIDAINTLMNNQGELIDGNTTKLKEQADAWETLSREAYQKEIDKASSETGFGGFQNLFATGHWDNVKADLSKYRNAKQTLIVDSAFGNILNKAGYNAEDDGSGNSTVRLKGTADELAEQLRAIREISKEVGYNAYNFDTDIATLIGDTETLADDTRDLSNKQVYFEQLSIEAFRNSTLGAKDYKEEYEKLLELQEKLNNAQNENERKAYTSNIANELSNVINTANSTGHSDIASFFSTNFKGYTNDIHYANLQSAVQHKSDDYLQVIKSIQNANGLTLDDINGMGSYDITELRQATEYTEEQKQAYYDLIGLAGKYQVSVKEIGDTFVQTGDIGSSSLDSLQEKFKGTDAKDNREIDKWLQSLNEDDRTLLATLDIDEEASLREIQDALAKAQGEADENPITISTIAKDIGTATNEISGFMEEYNKVMGDIKDGGSFDWTSLSPDKGFGKELQDACSTIPELSEQWNNLLLEIEKSPDKITPAMKEAGNTMLNTFLNAKLGVEEMSAESAQAIKGMLENQGYSKESVNAYVAERIAFNSKNSAMLTKACEEAQVDLNNANEEGVRAVADKCNAMIQEQGESENTRLGLWNVYQSQETLSMSTLNLDQQIQELYKMGVMADSVAGSIRGLSGLGGQYKAIGDKANELKAWAKKNNWSQEKTDLALNNYIQKEMGKVKANQDKVATEKFNTVLEHTVPNDYGKKGGTGGGGSKAKKEKEVDDLEKISKELDELQKNYQSLNEVVSRYNQTGKLTIDQAQALLGSDAQQIALLADENGQVQLNTKGYRRLVDAKLEDMKVQMALNGIKAIENLKTEADAVKYLANNYKNLKETSLEVVEKQLDDAVAKAITKGGKIAEAAKQIQSSLKSAIKLTSKVDYTEGLKDNGALSNLSSQLDNIQSSYKSLREIQAEYSKNKYLTVDQAQEIVNMDYRYLAMLDVENGKLKVSKDGFKDLAKAKLEEMKVQMALNAVDTINSFVDEADAVEYLANAYHDLADTSLDAAEGMMKAAVANAKMRGVKQGEAAETVVRGVENAFKMLDKVKFNDKSMGVDKDSSDSVKKTIIDLSDRFISRLEKTLDKWQKSLDKFSTFWNKNWAINNALKSVSDSRESKASLLEYYKAQQKKVKLPKKWKNLLEAGQIGSKTIYNEKLAEKITQYKDWQEKIESVRDAMDDLYDTERELIKQKLTSIIEYFDDIENYYNSITSKIDAKISLKNTMGQKTTIEDLVKKFASEHDNYDNAIDREKTYRTGISKDGKNWNDKTGYTKSDEQIREEIENQPIYKELTKKIEKLEKKNKLSKSAQKKLEMYKSEREALSNNSMAENTNTYAQTYEKWYKLQQKLLEKGSLTAKQQKTFDKLNEELQQMQIDRQECVRQFTESVNKMGTNENAETTLNETKKNIEESYNRQIDNKRNAYKNDKIYADAVKQSQKKGKKGEQGRLLLEWLERAGNGSNGETIANLVKQLSKKKTHDAAQKALEEMARSKQNELTELERRKADDLAKANREYEEQKNKNEQKADEAKASAFSTLRQIIEKSAADAKTEAENLKAIIDYEKSLLDMYQRFDATVLSKYGITKGEYNGDIKSDQKAYIDLIDQSKASIEYTRKAIKEYQHLVDAAAGTTGKDTWQNIIAQLRKKYAANSQDNESTKAVKNTMNETLDKMQKMLDENKWDDNTIVTEWQQAIAEMDSSIVQSVSDIQELKDAMREKIAFKAYDDIINKSNTALSVLEALTKVINDDRFNNKDFTGSSVYGNNYVTVYQNQLERQLAIAKSLKNEIAKAESISVGDDYMGYASEDEKTQKIAELLTQLYQAESQVDELKKAFRENVTFKAVNDAISQLDILSSKLNNFAGMIDDIFAYDGNHKLTEYGLAKADLISKELAANNDKIKKQQDLIKKIQNDNTYASEDEKKAELAQAESNLAQYVQSSSSLVNTLYNMAKEQEEQEVERIQKVIDKRKEALQAKKEYYDYDKNIRNQSKDIQNLTAQIKALENVNTAEAKAKVASLRSELNEKQDSLAETKKEHEYEVITQALDELSTQLHDDVESTNKTIEETMKDYYDKVSKLIASAEGVDSSKLLGNILERTLGLSGTVVDIGNILEDIKIGDSKLLEATKSNNSSNKQNELSVADAVKQGIISSMTNVRENLHLDTTIQNAFSSNNGLYVRLQNIQKSMESMIKKSDLKSVEKDVSNIYTWLKEKSVTSTDVQDGANKIQNAIISNNNGEPVARILPVNNLYQEVKLQGVRKVLK